MLTTYLHTIPTLTLAFIIRRNIVLRQQHTLSPSSHRGRGPNLSSIDETTTSEKLNYLKPESWTKISLFFVSFRSFTKNPNLHLPNRKMAREWPMQMTANQTCLISSSFLFLSLLFCSIRSLHFYNRKS